MLDERLKICHISEATSGGVMTHLVQLAKHLAPEKFKQTFVLSTLKNQSLLNEETFHGHELHLINIKRNISPISDLISLVKMVRFLFFNRFDVIHCHSSKAGVIGRLAAWLTGHKNLIYTPHSFSVNKYNNKIKNFLFSKIERCLSFITKKVICVSEGEYYLACKQYNLAPKNKLIVIPNGIEVENLSLEISKEEFLIKNGFEGNEKILCFVGRLCDQKNPEYMIRAFSQIENEKVVLLIAGEGPLRKKMELLVSKLKIEQKVFFLGEVKNTTEILSISDIFVNTSLWEGLPYVILEAMSVGVPVIATNIVGNTDLVHDHETGYLVNVNDINQLTQTINNVLAMEDDTVVENARTLIQNKHLLSTMVESLELFYEEVCDNEISQENF
ncbi:glycosyltransferase family 4 protein [Paenibacillus oleatilyticus]|uniref:Glycosyltransferase family 4 protein n=1 Tax=Paenibacillus oleatilyticus TaxID=2594886 RepID=A0ABV4V6Y3_9BACL